MDLAPSFSPPMVLTNARGTMGFIPQLHDRRRRVTLVHSKTAPARLESMAKAYGKKKKSVRFHEGAHLEQVRFFLKTQAPSAIRDGDPPSRPVSIELRRINWPDKMMIRSSITTTSNAAMIRMETVQVASNCDASAITLIGRCRVANLAFQKHVVVRYTTDCWQSFHETEAMYREPIASSANTWDRFSFQIEIGPDSSATTTLYLALRYTVNGTDYWDNNSGHNYQIDVTVCNNTEAAIAVPASDEMTPSQEKEEEKLQMICDHDIKRPSVDQIRSTRNESNQAKQAAFVVPVSPSASAAAIAMSKLSPPSLVIEPPKHVVAAKKKLGLRYDFGASLSEAKRVTSYPPPSEMACQYPFVGRLFEQHHVAPAIATESSDDDVLQLRYRDIIAKYCFYGNTASPPSPPTHPPSLSPCPSPEPICG
ncbi:putative phosphatase regulatory subunit-domain-containing protein [Dichotomocladium elegans]|nr:putative phosphatase regulatory subunit-domain-containing protein [Dichotomocladium elegans]